MDYDNKDTSREPLVYEHTSDDDIGSMKDTIDQDSGNLVTVSDKNEANKHQHFDSLHEYQIWGYGVGHVLNDLAAGMWFQYMLYFLVKVLNLEKGFSGLVILAGQITDAVTTPIIGVISDKWKLPGGRRKFWYAIGLFFCGVSFPMVFQDCPLCDWTGNHSDAMKNFFHIIFPCTWNFGWAFCQVTHMSLGPGLTCSRSRRDRLSNLRNTFTFVSQLTVLVLAALYFQIISKPLDQFQWLCYTTVAIGVACGLFFFCTVNENHLTEQCRIKTEYLKKQEAIKNAEQPQVEVVDKLEVKKKRDLMREYEVKDGKIKRSQAGQKSMIEREPRWQDWFKEWMFYQYGLVYMGARMLNNISASMIQFYLIYVLKVAKEGTGAQSTPIAIAIFPMITFLTSVGCSSIIGKLYVAFGRKKTFTLGAVIQVIVSGSLMFLTEDFTYLMYPIAIAMGISQSIMLNTSINLIGEVVGLRGDQGAIVYGFYSFFDKSANGLALYIIMNSHYMDDENVMFQRLMTGILPGGAGLVAWFLAMIGDAKDYKDDDGKQMSDFVSS